MNFYVCDNWKDDLFDDNLCLKMYGETREKKCKDI